MRVRRLAAGMLVVALGTAVALLAAACGDGGEEAFGGTTKVINMSAVEYKGSADVSKEPFPAEAPPAGGGYVLKEPKDGKWEVEAYRWAPEMITVFQGDNVEMRIFGINGAEHPSTIEGYVDSFTVKRGQLTTLNFKADKLGTFKIICNIHVPSMEGLLVVLPNP